MDADETPRLWLHVGPAKTGTKTIQTALHASAQPLRAQGVLYPPRPRDTRYGAANFHHHALARAMQENHGEFVRRYLAELPAAQDIILSSEGFQKVGKVGFETIDAITRDRYDLRVVYYARDPVDQANSMAQQSIKAGRMSYAECSKVRVKSVMRTHLERLISAFGRDRVVARRFDRKTFKNGDLLSDFCNVIGRDDIDALLPKQMSVNESMTLETALNIDAYRARTGDRTVLRADDPRFREGDTRFSLPAEVVAAIRTAARPDCDWLAETFGIRFEV